ncbi:hypothetical protein JCM19236_3491 [Vibrio sp. JCM 19236]|nr:hypothetical protein JCM19236_3491 [Vibrio sp. JCM 19236]
MMRKWLLVALFGITLLGVQLNQVNRCSRARNRALRNK